MELGDRFSPLPQHLATAGNLLGARLLGVTVVPLRMKQNAHIDKEGVWQTGWEVKRAVCVALMRCGAHLRLTGSVPPEAAGPWKGGGLEAD